MSLIARHLEANGLPTLCLASALDIVESARPPRAVFIDYPLGHTAGRAFDAAGQMDIITGAIGAFDSIDSAGQIITLPVQWPGDQSWRDAAVDPGRGDTRQTRDTTPRYQCEADRLLVEARTPS